MDPNARFYVSYWGTHPDEDNDDCWCTDDFDTRAEAEAVFNAEPRITGTGCLELGEHVDGAVSPIGHRMIPDEARRNRRTYSGADDGEARREMAMEAGMLHGVDAYNDAMGY